MDSLRFPEAGLEGLAGKWPDVSGFGSGFPKFLIYPIDSAPREAEEVYRALRKFDIEARGSRVSKPDWDEIFYLRPANQDFAEPTLQHVLNHHLHTVKQMRTHVKRTQHPGDFDWDMCLSGFLAITRADWREHGVTAVYCELDRAKWKVTQCRLPIAQLSRLDSVMEVDEYFDQLCKEFGGTDNDGPDNQGGPAPVGEWQFAVYCTATSPRATREHRSEAEHAIPDPCGWRNSYRLGEHCLHLVQKILSAELVRQDWPVEYATFVRASTGRLDVVKRHPSLFVHVCGDLSNIEIIRMEWDHEVTRSEAELTKIGRESKTTTQKCEAEKLVATLQELARRD
jgi:hypothetical protein